MVFNRLCDLNSRLRVGRLLETLVLPEIDAAMIIYQQLRRSMTDLIDRQREYGVLLARQLRLLIHHELSLERQAELCRG